MCRSNLNGLCSGRARERLAVARLGGSPESSSKTLDGNEAPRTRRLVFFRQHQQSGEVLMGVRPGRKARGGDEEPSMEYLAFDHVTV